MEREAGVGQHRSREHDLHGRIGLAHAERLDVEGLIEKPGEQHARNNQNVTADDGDHQPQRQLVAHAERNIDADDQELVGERVEIGAELGLPVVALGEVAVDGIADAGTDEHEEGASGLAGEQHPEDHRHRDDAGRA